MTSLLLNHLIAKKFLLKLLYKPFTKICITLIEVIPPGLQMIFIIIATTATAIQRTTKAFEFPAKEQVLSIQTRRHTFDGICWNLKPLDLYEKC